MTKDETPLSLTEDMIRQRVSEKVFDRGLDYVARGAVESLVRRGAALTADVEGSDDEPYRVTITLDNHGVTQADCTCPYGEEWDGWCKHIVATLLASLDNPQGVTEEPALEAVLAGLSREQLLTLLQKLAAHNFRMADEISAQAALLTTLGSQGDLVTPTAPVTPFDPKPFRQGVKAALRSLGRMSGSEAYGHVSGVVSEVSGYLDDAETLLAQGDGRNALLALEAITDAYVDGWTEMDDSDGDASAFFTDLGDVWAEALLTATLTQTERRDWAKKLDAWQREAEDYGVDDGLQPAAAAALQGWDDPDLQEILRGGMPPLGDTEEEWYADRLTAARLRVLERQGRLQEYLHLADAMHQPEEAASVRVKLRRTEEAVAYAIHSFTTPPQFQPLAALLYEQGAVPEAMRLAEHGLTRDGYGKASLALWLRDTALERGDGDLVLRAGTTAFQEAPRLADYQLLELAAGAEWPSLRDDLLKGLRQFRGYERRGAVDVFLHEGLTEDALVAVKASSDYELIGRVVDAAVETHPAQVLPICRQQAESIMDDGKAGYYETAARWLARAKLAYRAEGHEAEWKSYLADLMARHQRKYKLMPLLKKLQT